MTRQRYAGRSWAFTQVCGGDAGHGRGAGRDGLAHPDVIRSAPGLRGCAILVGMGDIEGFRDYVAGRMEGWRRVAYQLCGNWHTADDLVSIALMKVLRHWLRVSAAGDPDAYVRRILIRTAIDESRRSWQRESPIDLLPERAADAAAEAVTDRRTLVALLSELPPGKREVVVLRYVYDLSVEETAARLGCSLGTVKSQTARALEAMRAGLDVRFSGSTV